MMSLSFLTPSRTVLLVSDEALFVYLSSAQGIRLVASIPWTSGEFEVDVARIISSDCGKKPVLIVNDMVEQHYRKERVLKKGVGLMDRSSMIERKLNFAFPNYPIRAAMPLKEKLQKTSETAVAADSYIFVAIPNSEQFKQTLGAVSLSMASIVGVCLLPVEASDMVKALSDKVEAKQLRKSKWALLMGQHQDGSLRQIVTKNGEIALTRMTPMTASQDDPEAWANELEQEFTATMSYVSRFGYQPEDGLNIVTIADSGAGKAFELLIEENYEVTALTPDQAAKMLGISIGAQESLGYANPLHVAWIGRKTKFTLPLKATQVDEVSRPRKIAVAAALLLVLTASFFAYQLFSQAVDLMSAHSEISDGKYKQKRLQADLNLEIEKKKAMGFDVRLVQSSIKVHEELSAKKISTLALFRDIGTALGYDLRIDTIKIARTQNRVLPQLKPWQRANQKKPDYIYEAVMQMTYPGSADPLEGNKEVEALRDRLEALLPGHDVSVTKLLEDYEYAEEISVGTGAARKEDVKQDFIVELLIKGPAG